MLWNQYLYPQVYVHISILTPRDVCLAVLNSVQFIIPAFDALISGTKSNHRPLNCQTASVQSLDCSKCLPIYDLGSILCLH